MKDDSSSTFRNYLSTDCTYISIVIFFLQNKVKVSPKQDVIREQGRKMLKIVKRAGSNKSKQGGKNVKKS